MENFLILGLPRSRTKWLSHLFTTGRSFCHHDTAGHCRTVAEMAETMQIPVSNSLRGSLVGCDLVGSSCSGQAFVLDELVSLLPRKPRIVYIRRPLEEVVASFSRVTGVPGMDLRPVLELLDTRLDEAQERHPGLVVRYESLNGPGTIRWLWEHATGGLPFPDDHYHRLRFQNLQIDPAALRNAAREGHPCAISHVLSHAQH